MARTNLTPPRSREIKPEPRFCYRNMRVSASHTEPQMSRQSASGQPCSYPVTGAIGRRMSGSDGSCRRLAPYGTAEMSHDAAFHRSNVRMNLWPVWGLRSGTLNVVFEGGYCRAQQEWFCPRAGLVASPTSCLPAAATEGHWPAASGSWRQAGDREAAQHQRAAPRHRQQSRMRHSRHGRRKGSVRSSARARVPDEAFAG